jgi:sugar phosphate isomerase/epimerase
MNLNEWVVPSMLLCESHFEYRKARGVIADAVERVAEEGFFKAVTIAEVDDEGDRSRIRGIVDSRGIGLSQWVSHAIGDEGLNLCSLDSELRNRSVTRISDWIHQAAETGVTHLGVLCGEDPGPAHRADATEALYDSLIRLCQVIFTHPGMRLMIEPLDRDVHKKGLIGPASELVALVERLHGVSSVAGVCLDTSHAVLLNENPVDTLEIFEPYLLEIHFSNPVLDESNPYYGDHHIAPGPPGVQDVPDFARVLARGAESGVLAEKKPIVSVEVRTAPGGDPWETMDLCRQTMSRVLDQAASG